MAESLSGMIYVLIYTGILKEHEHEIPMQLFCSNRDD